MIIVKTEMDFDEVTATPVIKDRQTVQNNKVASQVDLKAGLSEKNLGSKATKVNKANGQG